MDAATWRRAKDLIGDALDLPPAEREGFLAARCPDPALLAEIRTLLREYENAPSFLEHPPLFDDLAEDDDLEPGSQVGPYVILDRLGRGGMGQVFLGNDRRLKRKVALKRLLPSRAGAADERARVMREARAAARINHPNVATIHDVIEHDARVFIVMEYVEGESLAARLRRERMPIDRVIAIGRQLTSALAAAHATGVVHRDLKPGNIQVAPDGTVKVLDFGIAQASIRASAVGSSRTTRSGPLDVRGAIAGTPEYMSPEQMMGGPIDQRSDLYSLGVVLFEMLAGRRPFADVDPLERLGAGTPAAPRVDTVNPGVPAPLADLVARALEVDPRRRFQSAIDMGAALEALQSEVAATETAAQVAKTPAARWRPWLLAAALAPAVLTGLGFMTSRAFNVTLNRVGPFARFATETPIDYLMWAGRSLIPVAYDMTLAIIAVQAIAFALRVARVWTPWDRLARRIQNALQRAIGPLGLGEPAAMAQALAAAALLALAWVWWRFSDLIAAWQGDVNVSPTELFAPLDPGNEAQHDAYVIALHLLTFGFGFALFRIGRLRTRTGAIGGTGALIVVGAILAVFVLMFEWPYRIMWQNAFERADLGGTRCYLLGEHEDDLLLHCPDTSPPRNRIVKTGDPAVRRLGVVESIFSPPEKVPR